MEYSLQASLPNQQKILQEFLYLAIFIPPGETPPDRTILDTPQLARYYQDWGKKGDRALFAVLGKQVLGACWSRLFSADNPGYGTIQPDIPELSIAVCSKARGMGIGTHLLSHFLNQLKLDFPAVTLSVDSDNPAIHLYQRFGFVEHQAKGQSLILIKRF